MAATTESLSEPAAAARRLVEEHRIHTVEVCFGDLWGYLCGRRVPAGRFLTHAARGFSFPIAPLTWSVTGDIAPSVLASPANGYPNIRFHPDLSTLRPATWRDGVAVCVADARWGAEGDRFPLDARHVLRRAVGRLGALGFAADVAPELEFYLCTEDWQPLFGGHRPFSLTKGLEAEPILTDVRLALERFGMVVESSQTEYGPAQFELNVGPTDPLRAADDVLFLKHVVKETARRHGARATFMPAPYQGESFSGFHLHQSLRTRDGARAWEDGAAPPSLARYLAGLLRRLGELSAVTSPSINAYKRSADYSFAANRVCWGEDNRSVAVRALEFGGPGARLEARTASSDANPYLVIAGCLAAGAEGLEQALQPPAPVSGDAYADASLARLPDSLAAAVELLETSEFCRDVLGSELVATLAEVQRLELRRFAEHVTDWERQRYLECS